jgi:hypothetical protein
MIKRLSSAAVRTVQRMKNELSVAITMDLVLT